jgi:hypothetical protein
MARGVITSPCERRLFPYHILAFPEVSKRLKGVDCKSIGVSLRGFDSAPPDCEFKHFKQRIDMSAKKSPYKIVRTYSAGVFLAIVESRNGQEAVLRDARRLWYWDGAASLSQLAMEGTVAPENCKFPIAVDRVEVLQVIEIIDVTPKAKASIDGVKIWKR